MEPETKGKIDSVENIKERQILRARAKVWERRWNVMRRVRHLL